MRILVTGADGFVGRWLVPALCERGHQVIAASGPVTPEGRPRTLPPGEGEVMTIPLELRDQASVEAAVAKGCQAVVHLAGLASGAEAARDPGLAWEINAAGTARLAEALGRLGGPAEEKPLLLLASTAEVYGPGPETLRSEGDDPGPSSAYGASKLGAEIAALEVRHRTGLRVVIARAFSHTGRGQDQRFVVPAFARRLIEAQRGGERKVRVGNLDPVREFLHVSDVVGAYQLLLDRGVDGEIYNVASGRAVSLRELFDILAGIVGHEATAVVDPALVRPVDVPYLVGESAKLRDLCGWQPRVSLEDALREVVDAQAN